MSTELTAFVVTMRYKKSSSLTFSLESRGGEARNFFSSLKASRQSSVQVKSCILCRTLRKGRLCSTDLDMNRLRVATRLVSYWTSFLQLDAACPRSLGSFLDLPQCHAR